MADLDVFKEDFALLFEAGMVAIKQGDEASAKALFQALSVLNPEHTAHELGIGLLHLHKMDLTKAEGIFRGVVEKDPENWGAKAFLSLTLMMIVLQQGSSFEVRRESLEHCLLLAGQVLENCEVESTKALAKSVLDWHDGLVAKSGGPLN